MTESESGCDFRKLSFLEKHLPEWARADGCAECGDATNRPLKMDDYEGYEACFASDKPRGTAQATGEYIKGTGIDLAEVR